MTLTPPIIAHRGFSSIAPENTMAAFDLALTMGAKGLEMDVNLSSDGEVFVFHDSKINRTSNGSGLIWNLSSQKIKKLDAGTWFSPEFSGEPIPTLAEVLKRYGYKTNLFIEIKKGKNYKNGIEKRVLDLIKKHGVQKNCILHSFHISILKECSRINNKIPLLFIRDKYQGLIDNPTSFFTSPVMKLPNIAGLNLNKTHLTSAVVREIKKRKMKVYSWTSNSLVDIQKLQKLKVDGIISNVPI